MLRDAHLGSIWEGTGNIVALDALTRAVGRHGAEAALLAELHAKLDDVPNPWSDRLRGLVDRAVGFARLVAGDARHEADARKATSTLYHIASAVTLAWEGTQIHAARGDARRLLLSKLVVDQRLTPADPFGLATSTDIADAILAGQPVPMAEAAQLLL